MDEDSKNSIKDQNLIDSVFYDVKIVMKSDKNYTVMNHSYESGCAFIVEQVQNSRTIDIVMEVDRHCYDVKV